MTIIEQIKAEIERRQEKAIESSKCTELNTTFYSGKAVALGSLLSFLSTLESEKPSEELEDILLEFYDEYDSNVENRPLIPRIYTEKLARHFAQWGAEHLATSGKTLEIKPGDEVTINGHKFVYDKDKGYVTIVKSEESVPVDLEEAAEKYLDELFGKGKHQPFYKELFIAGAKWQKEQMMKDTVETRVIGIGMCDTPHIVLGLSDEFKKGSKVRVIVLPKED